MKSLGLFFERADVPLADRSAAELPLIATNGACALGDNPVNQWLLEWEPSHKLEFTRAEIFDRVLKMRDDERERIGQELHDSAGQLLLALQLNVARLSRIEGGECNKELIEEIQEVAQQIGSEIRALAFLNHSTEVGPRGLFAALESLMRGFGSRIGCDASFKVVGDPPAPNAASSMALLRVAQEALVNVHRHAHATSVAMKLRARGKHLELTVRDDGVGLPTADLVGATGGVGLQGMRFRVERLGGRFSATNLNPGTQISASVPVQS